jgi:hypothetical protein
MSQQMSRPGTSLQDEGNGVVQRGYDVYADVRDHEAVQVKNRVQFGPIVAGILTAIATMLILTVLGLAIGASALEPRDAGQSMGVGAAIYGVISAIIAFFLGGWVAAKTAAVAGAGSGLINGLMVGAGILALVLWLTGSGVGAVVGALGSNVGDIANLVQDSGTSTQEAQQQAQQAQEQLNPNQAFDTVKNAAWGTLAGLLIPLVAAGLGGLVGHNEREDVIQGR